MLCSADERSSSDQALIHGGCPWTKCCTSCFEPVHVHGIENHKGVWWRLRRYLCISWRFDRLNMLRNFCSLCCAGLILADVSGGGSHKHDVVPRPTETEKTLDQERTDIKNLFIG